MFEWRTLPMFLGLGYSRTPVATYICMHALRTVVIIGVSKL